MKDAVNASATLSGPTYNSTNFASFCILYENVNSNSLYIKTTNGQNTYSVVIVKID